MRIPCITVSLLAAASLLLAQDQSTPPPPDDRALGQNPGGGFRRMPESNVPAQLTIPPGTFLTVRVNQPLSSDRNQAGDAFSATLERPLVVNGFIVAQRGQTIGGRVVEARKAGRVEGLSRLGIQLTDLTLVDGQQVQIQSQLINRQGRDSVGRDAGGLAATTLSGAAVGAAVSGGVGAGVGAAAGLVVGTIGVLLTRGHATTIYPESVLTFRVEAPVAISTDRAPQVFRYVDPNEYDRPYDEPTRDPRVRTRLPSPCGEYGCPPPPAPHYYGPSLYPAYYGPGLSFYYGPRFYGRGFYGRGFYGRGYYRR